MSIAAECLGYVLDSVSEAHSLVHKYLAGFLLTFM